MDMVNVTGYVVIVAGGKGLRMGGDIPKQFLPICGIPVLMRTIKMFRDFDDRMKIILVLPKAQQNYWKELCDKYFFHEPITIANGGRTRFHSVKNGLAKIPDTAEGVVMVHDGVRPFPSGGTIYRVYTEAKKSGAAIPVIPIVDTLRQFHKIAVPKSMYDNDPYSACFIASELHSITVPRDEFRIVQTPQAFDIQLLKKAYRQEYDENFTDDASVVENEGKEVTLVEGNEENIKITKPFDIAIAEAILKNA